MIRLQPMILGVFNFMEIWKDIPHYEGYYQVSNYGFVKSIKNKRIKILKNIDDAKGYYKVNLYINGVQKTKKVHQLVAITFLSHTPCGHKLVVNHINFNKKDNRLVNLELITQRENTNLNNKISSSKYVGVCWDKKHKKWVARILINKRNKYLGSYNSEVEASNSYQDALRQIPNQGI